MTRVTAAQLARGAAIAALCVFAMGLSACSCVGDQAVAPSPTMLATDAQASAHASHSPAPAQTASVKTVPRQAGLKIYLDEDGNRITPTPEMLREEAATRPLRSIEGLEVQQHPNGGYYIRLDDRFMMSSKATVTDDGRVVIECVPARGSAEPAAGGHGAAADPDAKKPAHGAMKHDGHGGCRCCGGGAAHHD
jgi:hypothetical protein